MHSAIAGWMFMAWLPLCSAADISASDAMRLVQLVRQDCGSCHGLHLTGGLGSSLLPDTLRDKPTESLIATILHGRPGTPMPPWKKFLTEQEASWIVDHLRAGFPQE